jgi:hypothetical protein
MHSADMARDADLICGIKKGALQGGESLEKGIEGKRK